MPGHRERPDPTPTVLVTDAGGARAHDVPEWQLGTPGHELRSLCGAVFLPTSMTAPDGRPCPLCREITRLTRLRAHTTTRGRP